MRPDISIGRLHGCVHDDAIRTVRHVGSVRLHGLSRECCAAKRESLRTGVERAGRADVLAGALQHSIDEGVVIDNEAAIFDRHFEIVANILEFSLFGVAHDRVRVGSKRGNTILQQQSNEPDMLEFHNCKPWLADRDGGTGLRSFLPCRTACFDGDQGACTGARHAADVLGRFKMTPNRPNLGEYEGMFPLVLQLVLSCSGGSWADCVTLTFSRWGPCSSR